MLSEKWFPGRIADEQSMGEALYLEGDYWLKMKRAVANGIAEAFRK